MTTLTHLDRNVIYKEIQRLIKAYTGPVKMFVLMNNHITYIYSDRSQAMRFTTESESTEWITWSGDFLKGSDHSNEGYAKFIFDEMLKRSVNGVKQNLPARKRITNSRQMPKLRQMHPHLDDLAITKLMTYLFVQGSGCPKCEIGLVEVSVGSYTEDHECINCNHYWTID